MTNEPTGFRETTTEERSSWYERLTDRTSCFDYNLSNFGLKLARDLGRSEKELAEANARAEKWERIARWLADKVGDYVGACPEDDGEPRSYCRGMACEQDMSADEQMAQCWIMEATKQTEDKSNE